MQCMLHVPGHRTCHQFFVKKYLPFLQFNAIVDIIFLDI